MFLSCSQSSSIRSAPKNTGFTLIELLVVIAIIGLLSSVVFASLNSARGKARDAQRMSDLREVQKALELYYHDNNTYPTTGGSWRGTETTGSCYGSHGNNAIPGLTPTYISTIPRDPRPSGSSCYLYRSDGTDYMFLAHNTVETFNPNAGHAMNRQVYNQQSIAVYSIGARNW